MSEVFEHKVSLEYPQCIHIAHDYSNYDDILDNYSENINKKSCFTCKHYDYGMGVYPKCKIDKTSKVGIGIDKTADGPQCFNKKRLRHQYWEPDERLTLECHIKKHDHLNDCLPSDTYDVYMYDMGGTRLEGFHRSILLFFSYYDEVEVPNHVYYIVKNKKYYYCGNNMIKGFIPLTNFNRVVGCDLCYWYDKQIPIDMVERWIYNSRETGELVYTTSDILEDKFKKFEK